MSDPKGTRIESGSTIWFRIKGVVNDLYLITTLCDEIVLPIAGNRDHAIAGFRAADQAVEIPTVVPTGASDHRIDMMDHRDGTLPWQTSAVNDRERLQDEQIGLCLVARHLPPIRQHILLSPNGNRIDRNRKVVLQRNSSLNIVGISTVHGNLIRADPECLGYGSRLTLPKDVHPS